MPTGPSIPERVVERIKRKLDAYLADPDRTEKAIPGYEDRLGSKATELIHEVLQASRSYRDALVIQVAFGLETALSGGHTRRPEGARSVGAKIGAAFAERHIAAVRDAYQNVGKNTDRLDRGNVKSFDDALLWLDTASENQRKAALSYALASISLTARNVLSMPELHRPSLTFYKCALLLRKLLQHPSGGAYQQYAVAAFLEALIEEMGQDGVNGLRVETKRLNASDAASKVVGDIQILRGNRIEEVFEVTANDWRSKVTNALASLRSADLQRIHILADVEGDFPANSEALNQTDADVTVIDVDTFLRTLLAIMRKPARAAGLRRLYEMLDRLQPDIERTNTFVRMLRKHGLVEA